MKWSPGRQFLFGFGGMIVAIAAAWMIPGATGRGMQRLFAQAAPAVQTPTAPAGAHIGGKDSGTSAAAVPPAAQTGVLAPGSAGGSAAQTTQAAPIAAPLPIYERLTGLIGIALIILLGYLMSHNRAAIKWRTVAWGLALQFAFAIFVLQVPFGQTLFRHLGDAVTGVLRYSYVGSSFVFGKLGEQNSSEGVIFAFQLLPAIIFVSALFAILYYLGVMQVVVRACAVVMTKLLGASGAESLNVGASIFMGQTEAPLTIRPFLARMTQSELMTVMTAGMAHVSGSIMAAYIAFGVDARHLLSAVIMTAPGTIMMAKMFEPETEVPETSGTVRIDIPKTDVNLLDAAARGTGEGLHLMLNVIAMLISFVALIALINGGMGWLHSQVAWIPENMQTIFAWVGRPVAWALGVPWHDSGAIGSLLGTRAVLNEFIAFSQLGPMKATLDPRSFTIASFALAGFANFSSVGIQIGGIGALVPNRKGDLARLGLRAMLAGTLANFLSAAIAGILL